MTTTESQTRTTTDPPIIEGLSPTPSREETIEAIAQTADVTIAEAAAFLDWYVATLDGMRTRGVSRYLPTTDELVEHHAIYDAVVPAFAMASEPGSAHATLEQHVLDGTRGEIGLRHARQERGGRQHCTVDVTIDVVG